MFKTTPTAILAACITSLLINLICYWSEKRLEIATVDIVSITSQFIKEEANKGHSNLEKEVAIKAFSHRLEQALNDLSHSKSLILVPKEAVIKGSHDYSAVLIAMLNLEAKS